jgi:hypothetical protein
MRLKAAIMLFVVSLPLLASAGVNVTVSTPAARATVTSPTTIAATANSNSTITAWQIYVDGTSVYSTGVTKSIKTSITLTTGIHHVVVRAWNSRGNYGSANLTETVVAATSPLGITPLAITTISLPNATVGTAYSATLTATGGTPPYVWSLAAGSLPSGLTLSSSGILSGTPSTTDLINFTVQAKDSSTSPQAATQSQSITINASPSTSILWHADIETGDLSQWYYPSTGPSGNFGGGEYDSGIASASASTDMAHSGSWSAKLSISTPSTPQSGTRMFRWMEPRQQKSAYYSVWIYIPTLYELTGDPSNGHFWNLLQFKTRTTDSSRIDPVWALYIDDSHPGQYYLKAGFGWGGTQLAGPYSGGSIGGTWFNQTLAPLPIGQWVHLEAFLTQSNSYQGQLTFWQDGVKVFDFQNVITSYNNCNFNTWCADDEWAVNLYSDGLTPNPAYIYIDDAKIATGYVQ